MNKEKMSKELTPKTTLKKFALIIEYGTGEAVMLTDNPDLQKALNELDDRLRAIYGDNKDSMQPHIISAKILPVLYEKT